MNVPVTLQKPAWVDTLARIGLIAKGVVYSILGVLAFMAAFELGSQSDANANRNGVFNFIQDAPGGTVLLVLLSGGLICYSLWRFVQAFTQDKNAKWSKRLLYVFSGLAYLSIAYTAIRLLLHNAQGNSDSKQKLAENLMDASYGQWLAGAAALIMAGIGIYQIWYGLSEKYKKHVQRLHDHTRHSVLLYSGKIGYVARGVVWLIIAFLLAKAALHDNASEAGDSGEAFQLLEKASYGSYLLGALGLGLIAYGVFNFIRARYEQFD